MRIKHMLISTQVCSDRNKKQNSDPIKIKVLFWESWDSYFFFSLQYSFRKSCRRK